MGTMESRLSAATRFGLALAAGGLVPMASADAKKVTYASEHQLVVLPTPGLGDDWIWVSEWAYALGKNGARTGSVKDYPDPLTGIVRGFTGPQTASQAASTEAARAEANAFAVAAFVRGGAYTGTAKVWGFAETDDGRSAFAFASSKSALAAGLAKTTSTGKILWRSVTSVVAQDCTHRPCGKGIDPIDYVATNLETGERKSGRLLDIRFGIDSGTGAMTWSGGVLSIVSDSLLSGWFLIDMLDPHSSEQGQVRLTFVDNLITEASGWGLYAGLTPAVGASALGPFGFGEPEISYDFGFGDAPIALDLSFSNGGSARVGDVPEPGIWALMIAGFGLVGRALRRDSVRGPNRGVA